MKVEISADRPVTEADHAQYAKIVESGLTRYQDRLTRAEVHLRNSDKSPSGGDPQCRLEVRPAGLDPVTVSDDSTNIFEAVRGAVGKMDRRLDSLFGKLGSTKGGTSASGQPT